MEKKIVRTQNELNEVVESDFDGLIIIQDTKEEIDIFSNGKATIDVGGSATIRYVGDSATIHYVRGSATIRYVGDSATIQDVRDSATIQDVGGSATIHYVRDSATIQDVRDSATIYYVRGSATIRYVGDSATIQDVGDNGQVTVYPSDARIKRATDNAVLIYRDGQKLNGLKRDKTVQVVRTKTFQEKHFSIQRFIDKYHVKKDSNGKVILYKSVTDGYMDHYTGTIKYELGKTVEAPDWDDNFQDECGHGLHLSPTPILALQFNQGKVLKCRVRIADCRTVKEPEMPTKVRCQRVEVLEECKELF